jgi:hypothetical protein
MNTHKIIGTIFSAVLLCAAPVSFDWTNTQGPSVKVETAHARVGRPGTPMSVAGVNRRAHRRAYYYGSHLCNGAYYNHHRCY